MGSHREDLNSFIPQKMYCDRRTLFLTLALILTFSAFEGVKGRPNGQEERRDGGMSNALKYLEELDKYYSQVARPRFGKRATPNMYAKSPMDNIMFSPQGYNNYE